MLKKSIERPAAWWQRLSNSYADAFRGLPKEVWFLAIVMFINRSGSMVLAFMSLYAKEKLGFSEQLAGLLMAYFGVGSCLGSLLGGWAASRVGALKVQVGAFLANAIGFVILSTLASYFWFAVTLFLMSILGEAFRPANVAAIANYTPPEMHPRAYALNRLAVNLGFSIGPPLGGWIASFSYFWLFQIDAATCLLAGIVLLFLFRGNGRHASAEHRPEAVGQRQSPWLDLNFLIFIVLTLLSFGIFFQLLSTYPMYLADEYQLREWQIGILLGLNTLGVVACEMVLVNRLRGWSKIGLIAWGNCLMCLGMSALVFGHGFWFAAAIVLIWTLGEMLAMPQSLAFVASYAGPVNRNRYMGAYTTAVSAAFVVASVAGSWCYSIHHDLIWYLGLGIGLAVLPAFMLIRERGPNPKSASQPIEATERD